MHNIILKCSSLKNIIAFHLKRRDIKPLKIWYKKLSFKKENKAIIIITKKFSLINMTSIEHPQAVVSSFSKI